MFTYYSYKFIYTAIYIMLYTYLNIYIYVYYLYLYYIYSNIYSYIYIYIHIVINIYIYTYVAGTFWYNATVLLSDPICFHTCLLVCSQLVSLFLYLHCDSSLWVLSVKGISPCLPFLTSLSIAQCSSFWWLWDRTQVPSVFVLVSLLHSHMWLFSLGASGAQYAPCPLSVYVLVPLVLSNSCPYFSLSLAVLLSRCLFGHMILSGSSLALSCSLQRVSLIPSPLLLLGEEWISWPLVFLPAFFPLFRSHSLTLSLYHVLPYLPSYLSPTCLLILSPLPCFFPGLRHLGRRG